jgi:hypothetical protein
MKHVMRAKLILGLLLLAGCCARPERSVALERPLERPTPLPTRTHRIALAELHRIQAHDAQAQAHQTAHIDAHITTHDAHPIVP